MSVSTFAGPLVSADSHVIEDPQLWEQRLPPAFANRAPYFGRSGFQYRPGGSDPAARINEMEQDGVSAEVLYPTLALKLFHLDDAALQQACFRVYNDWLADYRSVAPDRLIGVGAVSSYDIDAAVAEVERCHTLGLRGIIIWQVPPKEMNFFTSHHDPIFAVAAELGMPVSLHIVTGHDYSRRLSSDLLGWPPATKDELVELGEHGLRPWVNLKLLSVTNSLHDIIASGILEREPKLQIVLVENEIGWLPFVLDQWDKYFARPQRYVDTIELKPSELFERQVYATFFDDRPGTRQLGWWGQRNCMWSNDYPHPNTTWPDSRQVVARDLGQLPDDVVAALTWGNCAQLYDIDPNVITTSPNSLPEGTKEAS